MRSLSPSRTFTCTFTVSPDCIRGRSVIWPFSIVSITPMGDSLLQFHQLAQDFLLLHIQLGVYQQIGPAVERQLKRLPLSPLPDFSVVARHQHVRHLPFAKLGRPREVRVIQQPARKGIPS